MSLDEAKTTRDLNKGVKRKAKEAFGESTADSPADLMRSVQSKSEDNDDDDEEEPEGIILPPSKWADSVVGYQVKSPALPHHIEIINNEPINLNPILKSSDFQAKFSREWKSQRPIVSDNYEMVKSPFKICIINRILENTNILRELRKELYELDWSRRKTDLYDFQQSVDLKYATGLNIQAVYNFLQHTVMPWVGKNMGYNFTSISATCSFYSDTDYLLLHDDQQEDRVVAFVFYINDVKVWNQSFGGALQIYNHSKSDYQPTDISKSIFPLGNQLVLFPVTSISYHQVDEVTTKNFCRYSINGWFHGEVLPKEIIPTYKPPIDGLYSDSYFSPISKLSVVNKYISEPYTVERNIVKIQSHIEEHSEISLMKFIVHSKYSEVAEVLENTELPWEDVGPPNRYSYQVLKEKWYPQGVREMVELFKSEEMFRLLTKFTGLDLETTGSGVKLEVQKWSPGNYTLLSDFNWGKRTELDVIIFFGCAHVVGGRIEYVSEDEEIIESFVTIEPKNNTLNLIYRDTARFTTYVSKYTEKPYYALFCSYVENKG